MGKDNMENRFETAVKTLFAKYNMPLTQEQAGQMESYYESLTAANKEFNLTAITTEEEAALLHFFDSAFVQTEIPEGASVIDVGSGGGFPIVPLAIVRPDIKPTALEASLKKCNFIEQSAEKAGITIQTINSRAEDYARGEGRERYDVCTARAVSPLRILLELCIPLVKKGGVFLAYKSNVSGELQEAKNAMRALGVALENSMAMPVSGYNHQVLVFRKNTPTGEKYPRTYGKIKKTPL